LPQSFAAALFRVGFALKRCNYLLRIRFNESLSKKLRWLLFSPLLSQNSSEEKAGLNTPLDMKLS